MPETDTTTPRTVQLFSCTNCDENFARIEMTRIDGELYCNSCAEEVEVTCDNCGAEHTMDSNNIQEFAGGNYCEDCRDGGYCCDNCGDEFLTRDYAYDTPGGDVYCEGCYEERFEECDNCGSTMRRGNDCPHCDVRGQLRSYGYSPSTTVWQHLPFEEECPTNKTPYCGIELEFVSGLNKKRSEAVETCIDGIKNVYCKEDGSLPTGRGIELVTHPQTLRYFKKQVKAWKETLGKLKSMKCSSHDNKACGLHVHVSRAYMRYSDTDVWKARMMMWLLRDEFHQISRRDGVSSYAQYEVLKPERGYLPGGRYWALNCETGHNTIEFRLFRGSLTYETIRGSVEMCFAICQFTREKSLQYFQRQSPAKARKLWQDFFQWCKDKKTFGYFVKLAIARVH